MRGRLWASRSEGIEETKWNPKQGFSRLISSSPEKIAGELIDKTEFGIVVIFLFLEKHKFHPTEPAGRCLLVLLGNKNFELGSNFFFSHFYYYKEDAVQHQAGCIGKLLSNNTNKEVHLPVHLII